MASAQRALDLVLQAAAKVVGEGSDYASKLSLMMPESQLRACYYETPLKQSPAHADLTARLTLYVEDRHAA